MNTFVIADTHLDDPDIILYCKRPWCVANPAYDENQVYDFKKNNPLKVTRDCLEAHNQTIADNWNKMVTRRDRVIIVGDFAFANQLKWVNALNGKKIIIIGNHDELNKDALKCFEEVYDFGCVKSIGTGKRNELGKLIKERVTFCHYPMSSWPDSWNGSAALHAHSHFRKPELDNLLTFDVGVDGWGFIPIPWEAIQKKIDFKRDLIKARSEDYENNDTSPRGLYSPDPAQRFLDIKEKNFAILRSIGIEIGENSVAIPKNPTVKSDKIISVVIARANTVNKNGVLYTAESLQKLADGNHFFWKESTSELFVKLPFSTINDRNEVLKLFKARIAEVNFESSVKPQIALNPEV